MSKKNEKCGISSKKKKCSAPSDKECLGGNDGHKLTKKDVKKGYRPCANCRKRNEGMAPSAEGVSDGLGGFVSLN